MGNTNGYMGTYPWWVDEFVVPCYLKEALRRAVPFADKRSEPSCTFSHGSPQILPCRNLPSYVSVRDFFSYKGEPQARFFSHSPRLSPSHEWVPTVLCPSGVMSASELRLVLRLHPPPRCPCHRQAVLLTVDGILCMLTLKPSMVSSTF